MTECNSPSLSGFNIELLAPNVSLNVQDTNGNFVREAEVTIDCDGDITTGMTNANGCYSAAIIPGVTCTITISKSCYQVFVQSIILVREATLSDPSKNFVFKVEDENGEAIPQAEITIVSSAHNNTGETDENGFFEGEIRTEHVNQLTIEKNGYDDFTQEFLSFTPVSCFDTNYRVVPIIVLEA
ncbi:MAG: carboxypeptidase-like regulatory domain-containing protein [Bacteroidota bacterium]